MYSLLVFPVTVDFSHVLWCHPTTQRHAGGLIDYCELDLVEVGGRNHQGGVDGHRREVGCRQIYGRMRWRLQRDITCVGKYLVNSV